MIDSSVFASIQTMAGYKSTLGNWLMFLAVIVGIVGVILDNLAVAVTAVPLLWVGQLLHASARQDVSELNSSVLALRMTILEQLAGVDYDNAAKSGAFVRFQGEDMDYETFEQLAAEMSQIRQQRDEVAVAQDSSSEAAA